MATHIKIKTMDSSILEEIYNSNFLLRLQHLLVGNIVTEFAKIDFSIFRMAIWKKLKVVRTDSTELSITILSTSSGK